MGTMAYTKTLVKPWSRSPDHAPNHATSPLPHSLERFVFGLQLLRTFPSASQILGVILDIIHEMYAALRYRSADNHRTGTRSRAVASGVALSCQGFTSTPKTIGSSRNRRPQRIHCAG